MESQEQLQSPSYDADQLQTFEKFKALINENCKDLIADEANSNFMSDECLFRYLRARDWKIDHSFKMLKETLTWRKEFQPQKITEETIKGILDLGTFYQNGFDKSSRPVLYIKPGAYNPYPAEQRVQYLVYLMEKVTNSMEKGVEKTCWVLDFSDYGSRVRSPDGKTVAQNSLHILQNHYPERLGNLFVVNPPWYFTFLYTIISPFMDHRTKQKIKFISGSKEELADIMSNTIPIDQLEETYGGTLKPIKSAQN